MFVLEFDYRSDSGPTHVGPFQSRQEAFSWAERTIGGGEASYHAYPLSSPRDHDPATVEGCLCAGCRVARWHSGEIV